MKFNLVSVEGVHTGILNGQIFQSSNLTVEQLHVLVNNPTEQQVLAIFNPTIAEDTLHNLQISEFDSVLVDSGMFEKEDNSYYRIGIPYSVPKLLLDRYVANFNDKDKIAALDKFWLYCSLNPNPDVRENLIWFIDRWGFEITSTGYIVGYRNVDVKIKGDKVLHDFIASSYSKVKNVWKKKVSNYTVLKNIDEETYTILHKSVFHQRFGYEAIGNLQEMYDNLSDYSQTVYTDSFSKSFTIKIGYPVSMPRELCDHTQATCSKGLHFGAKDWLEQGYFGYESIMVLVNPFNIISIPRADNYGKIRCCEYLPYSVIERDEDGKIISELDDEILEEEYDNFVLDTLNLSFKGEGKVYAINPKNIEETNQNLFNLVEDYAEKLNLKNIDFYSEEEE